MALFLVAAIALASAQGVRAASLPPVTVKPTSLAFGNQDVGLESAAKTVKVTNNQTTSLTILSITTNLSDYTTTTTCPLSPATLAAGATCSVSVFFTPSVSGARNGTLTVTANAGSNPTVSLTGTGVVPPSVSPSSLTFGSQTVGTTSASQQVTLTNTLPTALTISSISSTLSDYLVSSACPISPNTLAAGTSCSTTVTFSPKATGNRIGTLRFKDNAQNSPQTVSLSGVGVPATLQSISVTPQSPSIPLGSTLQFTATGTYSNGTTKNLTSSAKWVSSAPKVATIGGGLAKSLSQGTTNITATVGGIVGSSTLTVTPAALILIVVAPQGWSIPAGTTQQYSATGIFTDGTKQDLTNSATWASSATAVASINNTGLATGVASGTTTISATSGTIVGSATLTVTPAILSRVPERVCLIESETSLSVACTLSAGIPAGNGVAIFMTSTTAQAIAAGSLQDSEGNTYTILGSPTSGGYGTIYAACSLLTTALQPADAITLNVPGADSWGLSIYDVGPAQGNQPDVGVTFQNPNVGLPGVINPYTGVPGWWTGQTPFTNGTQDLCLTALGVGAGGSGDGAPAPITSYTLDGNFTAGSVTQFYSQSDPNYINGGTLLAAYVEVPAGSSVQSHITGPNGNTAPAVLYCFSEAPGAVVQSPRFTGNYCTGAATCSVNNVAAGDMLIISGHTFSSLPPTPITVTDTQNETVTFDQINNITGLGTWHISLVVNSGTHTISVNDVNDSSLVIDVAEISNQASGNPVESLAQASLASSPLGVATLETSVPNDLLYGWGRASQGTDEGEGFNALRVTPTAEYAIAPGAGAQAVTILPRPPLPATTVGDQAMAIRPAGTTAPPITGPGFTGNYSYCQYATSCTINNVAAGDMLVLTFFWWGVPADAPVATDNLGEALVIDRNNDTDGSVDLALWHIASVVNAGSHTLSVSNFSEYGPTTLIISEYSAQSSTNPVDSVTGATGSGALANTSVVTSQGNDWIYVACVSPVGTTAADNYAQIAPDPSVNLRPAASTAGTESASCPLIGSPTTWVIEELAIKH